MQVLGCLCCKVLQCCVEVNGSLAVSICRDSLHVGNMYLRSSRHADITEDTRKAEHVLCFEEATVWWAINLNCYLVLTLVNIRADIEPRRVTWVLWETNITAVNPQIEERVDTIKVQIDLLTIPCSRDVKAPSERANLVSVFVCGVVLRRFTHNSLLPVAWLDVILEYNPLINIDRYTILQRTVLLNTRHIPTYRHLQTVPPTIIVAPCEEVFWTLIRVLWEVKTPLSVKREIVFCKLW